MMRGRGSKKQEAIDKEEIINYEYRMIELSLPVAEPVICNPSKYAPWELQGRIRETIGAAAHSVRWVGNSETAYLESYAYMMLMGSGESEGKMLEFKHTVYRLGRKCLEVAEQKQLVEFLCLIEYSRDKYAFLNKYPQVEAIFIKILQFLQQEHTNSDDSAPEHARKAKVRRRLKAHQPHPQANQASPRSHSLSQELDYERELEQIYRSFSSYFQFITLTGSNEFSCTFRLFDSKKIHLLIEKDCYFMVELTDPPAAESAPGRGRGSEGTRGESSGAHFDKKEFLDIFNYKSEVEESNVISVERGSQIRKAPNTFDTLAVNTPKFNSAVAQAFPCPQEFEIQKNEEKIEHDRTFIDELLNNVVMPDGEERPREGESGREDKMRAILMIKEELRRVQLRIQSKIKLIDSAKAYQCPPDLAIRPFPLNPTSEKLETSKEKAETSKEKLEASKEFRTNIVKESVVRKHESFFKKERKTSYNSVKIIPYSRPPHSRHDENAEAESPTSPKNRASANPLHRVDRMLSEKAISRPHSNLKGVEQQAKKYHRSRSPQAVRSPEGVRKEYKVRSISPKNVNVNVNVNINENLLAPIYKDSFPLPYKQLFHKPPPQYYLPPHLHRPKPHFLERVKSKLSNPEASFTKSGKLNLLTNK